MKAACWLRSFDLDIGLQTNNLQIGMSILNSPCAALCGASESNLSSYFAMLDCHEREREREREGGSLSGLSGSQDKMICNQLGPGNARCSGPVSEL